MVRVEEAYKEMSLYQFSIGFLLFIIIVGNLEDIFSFIPNSGVYLEEGRWVAFFIACSRLSTMIFSISSDVIVMSSRFRYNFFMVIMLIVLSVLGNYVLIPYFGVNGAAFATLLSLFVYDVVNYLLVLSKFRIQFFSYRTVLVVLIGLFSLASVKLLPQFGSSRLLFFCVKVVVSSVVYFSLLVVFNIFPELTRRVRCVLGLGG
jgi:O-antigen/teichoic acid export membrane protein